MNLAQRHQDAKKNNESRAKTQSRQEKQTNKIFASLRLCAMIKIILAKNAANMKGVDKFGLSRENECVGGENIMIAQQTVDEITHAPIPERLHVIEVILESLKHDMPSGITEEAAQQSDRLLGLFAEDTELLDQISESAMQARERDSLRVS